MTSVPSRRKMECITTVPEKIPKEITEFDYQNFMMIISTDLNDVQRRQIVEPAKIFHRQETVLAIHWHPEFVPIDLIEARIRAMYPNRQLELIIPTQHNELSSFHQYTGVEVDCYSKGFNQKVQLLIHFESSRLDKADLFRQMLSHTFKYRSHQLFDFIHAITGPDDNKIQIAAKQTGTNDTVISFVQTYVKKIETLLNENYTKVPPISIKNKLLRNFFDCLRDLHGDLMVDRAQNFLQAVKLLVKADMSLEYFYRTSEIIEEARRLGAGIVVPHPEQFWPILLADYDVDGYEVWNPQSQRYTEFLISVVKHKNQKRSVADRELLVFMGDDTHMGEKTRDPKHQEVEKASREIGYQPSWDYLPIRKALIKADFNRKKTIEEYTRRLSSP